MSAYVLLGAPAARAAIPSAEEILQQADEVRNPQQDYTVWVKVTSTRPKRKPLVSTYEVLIKGRDKTLIKTLTPSSEQGRLLLMNDTALWAFLPKLSKPLRISLQERLIGDVANGDLARTNFSGDYEPKLVDIVERDGRAYYALNLTATQKDVTYARIALLVECDTYKPFKAEFFALSGRLLKTATYGGYQEMAGRVRPTALTIRDAVNTQSESVIEYQRMRVAPLPDKYFTKDYMKKLME